VSGCVSVEYTASTQCANAFIPEAASNLPGAVAAASGSRRTTRGASLGSATIYFLPPSLMPTE
jgi:hypothetical protein